MDDSALFTEVPTVSELTPLMKQYFGVKEQHPDAIVLFRLGDFYEMFGEDAKTASSLLQIALTTRDKGKDDPIPMCGVPYFSADGYITKLIRAGHKVAVCEQVEDPKLAKGIVERKVVRVITPGTHSPDQPKENAYLMSIAPDGGRCGVTVADLSTGEFTMFETEKPLEDEIERFEPREILCGASRAHDMHYAEVLRGRYVSYLDDWHFEYAEAYKALLRHFRVSSLDGYGCGGMTAAIGAAGALITYLEETQKVLTFKKISVLNQGDHKFLDGATKRNLELLHNMRDGSSAGTLLWVLDETLTPMGGRYLRNALAKPLVSLAEIRSRQDAVQAVVDDYELMEELRTTLRKIQDVERITARIISRSASPRDLIALRSSLESLPKVKYLCGAANDGCLKARGEEIADFTEVKDLISAGIVENPPLSPKDGGIIRKGYRRDVDELRHIASSGRDVILRLESGERQRTGISSLKVGFNNVFGYYFEVTKPNLDLVPSDYVRKQTLAHCERFTTQELKDFESKVLGAEDRLREIEHEIFLQMLDTIQGQGAALLAASAAVAVIDMLTAFAVVARRHDYTKPVVAEGDILEVVEGRHPVLERLLKVRAAGSGDERFIPNNALLDGADNRMLIITGPNMAGKSTYMRQVALIVLMAHTGSFVPATRATIGVTDRIFTRIGASDAITRGQSTFMVEMIEAANILNNATCRSLVLLDEVGRGTSTFDGISIAWAVAEHLVKTVRARTLFATHYHELTDLALRNEGIVNYNVVVKEWGDEIIFLRKIERGPADKSYGIHVARLAGLPESVIEGAKEILDTLERREADAMRPRATQMDLFARGDPLARELLALNVGALTPQKALRKLGELRKKAESLCP
jgi:DNA mismatch repair protein MutS